MSEQKQNPFICLVGAGRWGQNLLRDLYNLGVLACVCEPSTTLVQKHLETYPKLKFFPDINELNKQNYPHVSAVVIAVPATLHFKITKQCLLKGYDVMVEKPLSLHYSEGQELINLATKMDKILMVGHLLQYHPAFLQIKEMIVNDDVGRIQYVKSNRLNLGQVRTGENVLWSFAPHDISIILTLMDNVLPKIVSCSGFSTLNPPICDVSTTILHFGNQYAEINVNWLYPYKEQSLIIVGDKGMITFKDSRTNPELMYYSQPITIENGEVILHRNDPQKIDFNADESPLTSECKHFIHCCHTRQQPRTNGIEANRVLAVLELAQRSLDQKGTPLKIEEIIGNDGGTGVDDNENENVNAEKEKNKLNYWKHESAIVDDGVEIGEGSKVWHNAHIMKSKIGKNCSFGQSSFVGQNVIIGNNCRVQNNVNIYSGVEVEDGVFFGPNCTTTNDKNPRAEYSKSGNYLKTYIEKGVTIGAGAIILPGIRLGKYCMIGAGSVVTHNVPEYAVMVGNPARMIGQANEKGEIKRY